MTTNGGSDLDLTYDKAGNLRTQEIGSESTPTVITYTHDLWNRLVKVAYTPNGGSLTTRSEYTYNALNWRIMKRADTNPGSDTDLDQQRAMFYSANWQLVYEHVDDDEGFPGGVMDDDEVDADYDRDQRYVWGPRYIDDIVLRQRDGEWNEGKQVFEYADTYYHCTDAQFSTVAVLDANGDLQERVSYDPYGRARHHKSGDCSLGDGGITIDDQLQVTGTWGSTTAAGDVTRDGEVDIDDLNFVIGQWGAGLAFGLLSTTDNQIGWDGYVFNPEITDDGMYTVRYRHYRPGLGRWLTRDPLGYVDGTNQYQYVAAHSITLNDPFGYAGVVPLPPCATATSDMQSCVACCRQRFVDSPYDELTPGFTNCWSACIAKYPMGPSLPTIRANTTSPPPTPSCSDCVGGAAAQGQVWIECNCRVPMWIVPNDGTKDAYTSPPCGQWIRNIDGIQFSTSPMLKITSGSCVVIKCDNTGAISSVVSCCSTLTQTYNHGKYGCFGCAWPVPPTDFPNPPPQGVPGEPPVWH